ncbi:hypothetical protein FOA52_013270 [Chlamydomonas sp. UWO 241]|nr:hypothetical protein FOA52_013270 [Chlamydomonas sp. UWO 241]
MTVPPPSRQPEHSSSSSSAGVLGAQPQSQPQPPASMVFNMLGGCSWFMKTKRLTTFASRWWSPPWHIRLQVDLLQVFDEHTQQPNSSGPGVLPRSASRQKMADGLERQHAAFHTTDSSPDGQSGTSAHVQRAGSIASGMPLLATLIELRLPGSKSTLDEMPMLLQALLEDTTAPHGADGSGSTIQLDLLGDVLLQNDLSLAYWGNLRLLGEKSGPTMVRAMLPATDATDMLRTVAQCWRVRADDPEELPLHAPWKRALMLPVCYKIQGRLVDGRTVRVQPREQCAQPGVATTTAPPAATVAAPPAALLVFSPAQSPRSPRSPGGGRTFAGRQARSVSMFKYAPLPMLMCVEKTPERSLSLPHPEASGGSFLRLRSNASGGSVVGMFRPSPGADVLTGLGMTGGMSANVMQMLSSINMAASMRLEGGARHENVASAPVNSSVTWPGSGIDEHSRTTLLRAMNVRASASGVSNDRHETTDMHSGNAAEHPQSLLFVSDANSPFQSASVQLWGSTVVGEVSQEVISGANVSHPSPGTCGNAQATFDTTTSWSEVAVVMLPRVVNAPAPASGSCADAGSMMGGDGRGTVAPVTSNRSDEPGGTSKCSASMPLGATSFARSTPGRSRLSYADSSGVRALRASGDSSLTIGEDVLRAPSTRPVHAQAGKSPVSGGLIGNTLQMLHAPNAHVHSASDAHPTLSLPEDSVWPAFNPQEEIDHAFLQRKVSGTSDDGLNSTVSTVASDQTLVAVSVSPGAGKKSGVTGNGSRWQEVHALLVLDQSNGKPALLLLQSDINSRAKMITIVNAYSPTEAASDKEAGDFYLRVAALADKANDKRDLLIVAGGSQRRAWDSSQLRRPAVRREFNLQLSDRFGLLEAVPPEGADAQAEYDAMAAAIREVATNHLAPRGSRRRRGWQFTLSQRTLRLMDARQRAHSAWLRSKSAAAKRERNRANRAADAAVQRDRERWIGQQVAEAQDMLRKKNLRQFARACDRLAGRSRSHQIPPAMRDVSGALHSGPDGVLKAMTESFDKLYGGETKLSDETLNQLENDVAAFELTRATEVDEAHGRPPDLAETEACVVFCKDVSLPPPEVGPKAGLADLDAAASWSGVSVIRPPRVVGATAPARDNYADAGGTKDGAGTLAPVPLNTADEPHGAYKRSASTPLGASCFVRSTPSLSRLSNAESPKGRTLCTSDHVSTAGGSSARQAASKRHVHAQAGRPPSGGGLIGHALQMLHAANAHVHSASDAHPTLSLPEDSIWPAFNPQEENDHAFLQRKSDDSFGSNVSTVASEQALVAAPVSPEAGKAGGDQDDGSRWQEVHALMVLDQYTDRPALLLLQSDIHSRAKMEAQISQLVNAQLGMLKSMFPRHVLGGMLGNSDLESMARQHEGVSILFMDIVGFTTMSKLVPPTAVMSYLNTLFYTFDKMCDQYGVFKIETAGDCYIVAGAMMQSTPEGCATLDEEPVPEQGVRAVMGFARAMLRVARTVLMPHNNEPSIVRVGVHTGSVVSGVIGSKLPKFSLFGDTMNTSSRMESTAPHSCIQVSATTYALMDEEQRTAVRASGGVEVKGKGLMETYVWDPSLADLELTHEDREVMSDDEDDEDGTCSDKLGSSPNALSSPGGTLSRTSSMGHWLGTGGASGTGATAVRREPHWRNNNPVPVRSLFTELRDSRGAAAG